MKTMNGKKSSSNQNKGKKSNLVEGTKKMKDSISVSSETANRNTSGNVNGEAHGQNQHETSETKEIPHANMLLEPNGDDIFTVYLKALTGSTLKLQISKTDSNIEIKQLLAESVETCFISSYELRIGERILEDFADISDYPEICADSTITMKAAPYDDKGARMHVYRLRELLDSRLDDMYLSTASVDKVSETYRSGFPSFSALVTGETYNDLAYALSCDMEFQQYAELQSRTKKKNKKKSGNVSNSNATSIQTNSLSTASLPISIPNPDNNNNNNNNNSNSKGQQQQQKNDNNNNTELESQLNIEQIRRSSESIPESFDTRQLFGSDKFSLKPFENYTNFTDVKLPKCVRSITFSGWNPPPGNRKLCGDLFYLQVETFENKKFDITSTPSGFYINSTRGSTFDPKASSPIYHTLLGLLWEHSPHFQREFPQLLSARTKRHPFEVTPVPFIVPKWLEVCQEHRFDANRSEESLFTILGNDPRVQQREWNEEYQSCKELPSGTMEERIIRDRTLFKIHCDFVDAATKGAKAVVDKCLLPVNPIDPIPAQVYIQNNIFFSFAVDSKEDDDEETDSEKQSNTRGNKYGSMNKRKFEIDQNAYANANNDLKGVIAFNEADIRGVHTLASAIIDYKGHRVIAQSIIPGILQSDQGSKHVYGSIDDGKTFAWDEKYHKIMKEASEKLHLKEHKVLDAEGKECSLYCPVECKGIVGSDGRFYILDLVRITPRDANYPNNHTAILRPELVNSYIKHKTFLLMKDKYLEQREKEDHKKKDDASSEGNDTFDEHISNLESEETKLVDIRFNPDVFTPHKLSEEGLKEEMDSVIEISKYLKEVTIPSFVKEVKNLENIPLDGITLTEALHSKGINMRYLGDIARMAEKQGIIHLYLLCLQEMVVRSCRVEFNSILRDTADDKLAKYIAKFLNCLLGASQGANNKEADEVKEEFRFVNGAPLNTENLRKNIIETVKAKFSFTISDDYFTSMPRLSTLRSFCLRIGLRVSCRDYDFSISNPFLFTDIQRLEPVVKQSIPKSSTATRCLEMGKQLLADNRFENAYEFLGQAIVMFQQVKGPMNREVASCFSYLATILFHASDLPQAILHQHKALVITRRVLGTDHASVCNLHQLLGMLCHSVQQTDFALKHFLRARYFCNLVCGIDHPDMAIILTNISMMYQDLGDPQRSMKYLREALRINEKVFGEDHPQTASTHHALAVTYSLTRQYKEALNHERKYYQIISAKFGKNDYRVKESSQWLEHFTSSAVQQAQFTRQEEQEAFKTLWRQTNLLGLTPDFTDSVKDRLPADVLEFLGNQTTPKATTNPPAGTSANKQSPPAPERTNSNASATAALKKSKKKKK